MKYERLTLKDHNSIVVTDPGKLKSNGRRFEDFIKRLAELEDKIENDTLVELPCCLGDTIYTLWYKKPRPWTVCGLWKGKIGNDEYISIHAFTPECTREFNIDDLGKVWFLTESDAYDTLYKLK